MRQEPNRAPQERAKPETHTNPIVLAGPMSEFSFEFVQQMANRMSVSYHKYGPLSDAYPIRMDAVASINQRVAKYQETGNTEWLVDAANYALIEYLHPSHPNAHFLSTDSDCSPGRLALDGSVHHDRF
jgi:hypothetical protein